MQQVTASKRQTQSPGPGTLKDTYGTDNKLTDFLPQWPISESTPVTSNISARIGPKLAFSAKVPESTRKVPESTPVITDGPVGSDDGWARIPGPGHIRSSSGR